MNPRATEMALQSRVVAVISREAGCQLVVAGYMIRDRWVGGSSMTWVHATSSEHTTWVSEGMFLVALWGVGD